jgi:His-Xaa-Ser system protein HxsD
MRSIFSEDMILDAKIYPVEVILSATYAFSDRFFFLLEDAGRGKIRVKAGWKARPTGRLTVKILGPDFFKVLSHYSVRAQISKNNKKIREYIVGSALCAALPFPSQGSDEGKGAVEVQEDPLGIAIPWEKKYGQKKKRQRSHSTV